MKIFIRNGDLVTTSEKRLEDRIVTTERSRQLWAAIFLLTAFLFCIGALIFHIQSDSQTPPKQVQGLWEATKWTWAKDTVIIYELTDDSVKYYFLSADLEGTYDKMPIPAFKKLFRQIE